MIEVLIEYQIVRDEDVLIQEEFTTHISDEELAEIDAYICESIEHASAELENIPAHIYDRLCDDAYTDAYNRLEGSMTPLEENDEIVLQTYLPGEIVDALSDEAYSMLPPELFEGDDAVYYCE